MRLPLFDEMLLVLKASTVPVYSLICFTASACTVATSTRGSSSFTSVVFFSSLLEQDASVKASITIGKSFDVFISVDYVVVCYFPYYGCYSLLFHVRGVTQHILQVALGYQVVVDGLIVSQACRHEGVLGVAQLDE